MDNDLTLSRLPRLNRKAINYGLWKFKSQISRAELEKEQTKSKRVDSTRKNGFINGFSPSRNGIYVKIDNFHKCHLCQCQENFKAILTYTYVKVFLICGITYVIGSIAYVNVGHNKMLRLLMKNLI